MRTLVHAVSVPSPTGPRSPTAAAVKRCRHSHPEGELDDHGMPTRQARLCDAATHLIDQMVQSCDAGLEWEVGLLGFWFTLKHGVGAWACFAWGGEV